MNIWAQLSINWQKMADIDAQLYTQTQLILCVFVGMWHFFYCILVGYVFFLFGSLKQIIHYKKMHHMDILEDGDVCSG